MAGGVAACVRHVPAATLDPATARSCAALAAGPAATPAAVDLTRPAIGFDPFNTFGVTFSQALIVSIAKAMAANGMRDAGYRYVILDDGWQGPRDAAGKLTADPRRFPCGIRRLAGFLHRHGFLLGIYTTPSPRSCAGRAGSAGHVTADARTFAGWGVDYVKLDWCNANYAPAAAAAIARRWRQALTATRRPIVLSINAGGSPAVAPWASGTAGSWRVGGDICGSWYDQSQPPAPTARRCYHDRRFHMGIYDYLTSTVLRAAARYAGPGHYIDPDMLEVGTAAEAPGGRDLPAAALTFSEARTNFAIWAMWSAPLIAGNDPRTMTGQDAVSRILLNSAIISVDQDPLGRPATLWLSSRGWQVWRKPLSGGRAAIAIVNLTGQPATAALPWPRLGVTHGPAAVTDLWTSRDVRAAASLRARVGAHGTAVYLVTGQ